jgi:hypothetical protein
MRSENELTLNKPILLMSFSDGKKMEARALPVCEALAWSEQAEDLYNAYAETTKGGERAARVKALQNIIDFVADYPWLKADAEAVKTKATSEQVIHAFYELRDINDPFVVAAKREEISRLQELESARGIMAMIPEAQREAILSRELAKQQME